MKKKHKHKWFPTRAGVLSGKDAESLGLEKEGEGRTGSHAAILWVCRGCGGVKSSFGKVIIDNQRKHLDKVRRERNDKTKKP